MRKIKENTIHDVQWPPKLTGGIDTVDVLMPNYSPDTGRPDGITPDELDLQTQPYPTGLNEAIQGEACGNCRFYVDGGACALVKGPIEPVKGICKFYEGGTPSSYDTLVFPIYEKEEANYHEKSSEPYLRESVTMNIIDREHQLLADGVPENEVHDILQREFDDTSISTVINEAEWREEDHQRVPAGSFRGGEFVSHNKPTTAAGKEGRQAREEFYASTNDDNAKVEDLHMQAQLLTVDANYAKLKGNLDEEQAIRARIDAMRAEEAQLTKSLTKEGKLEGVQAQRTLNALADAESKLVKAKPGSRAEEKLKTDVMINRMRLDNIRRGIMADFDQEGNPTNEAGYQQRQEENRVNKAMSKRVVKTHQKDLQGFKDVENIKLGRGVDKGHAKQIEGVWNGLDSKDRKLVSGLTIRGTRKAGSITAGEYVSETNSMEITTHPLFTEKDYTETIHHEIAHAKFKRISPEQLTRWNESVKDIKPPTKYANYHKQRYENYRLNNARARAEDIPVIKRNIKALENLYYEEVHSEVYSNLKSPLPDKKLHDRDGLTKATNLYKEMFG